ncbi:MAG: MFS transporter [archaeon GB-1867-035]|nr:MFS transporter [Candidatus Culexmicrobium profundum]
MAQLRERCSLDFGLFIFIQMTTYIPPAARLAEIYDKKPLVVMTFTFFSLFPLTFILILNANLLPLAFIIAGLREIGKPARKALIVDLAGNENRGKTIGFYYMIRGFTNILSPFFGGFLWTIFPLEHSFSQHLL